MQGRKSERDNERLSSVGRDSLGGGEIMISSVRRLNTVGRDQWWLVGDSKGARGRAISDSRACEEERAGTRRDSDLERSLPQHRRSRPSGLARMAPRGLMFVTVLALQRCLSQLPEFSDIGSDDRSIKRDGRKLNQFRFGRNLEQACRPAGRSEVLESHPGHHTPKSRMR